MHRLFCWLAIGLASFAPLRGAEATSPRVVLKLDDMRADSAGAVPQRWVRVIDLVEKRKLRASVGVICDSLEADRPRYLTELKRLAASERFELWHHGYDHRKREVEGRALLEFQGEDEARQREHFERGSRLAREKLGLVFTTFGAPFNATDAATTHVLAEHPEITVWLYGDAKAPAGKRVAARVPGVNIEQPVHVPNLAALKAGLEKRPREACYVIQGHPNSWDDAAFAEFVRILDFLTERGATFLLPRELAGEAPDAPASLGGRATPDTKNPATSAP